METSKKSLLNSKLSKNDKKKTDTTPVFIIENSGLRKSKVRNANPSKIISIAWRKAERLDDQIRKIMI